MIWLYRVYPCDSPQPSTYIYVSKIDESLDTVVDLYTINDDCEIHPDERDKYPLSNHYGDYVDDTWYITPDVILAKLPIDSITPDELRSQFPELFL